MDNISIKMHDGDKVLSKQMLLGEIVFMRGQEIVVGLLMFDILDFVIILGINFLGWYKASLIVERRKFNFN